eukprot:jgi/Chlat1/1971/Chrsp158S02274
MMAVNFRSGLDTYAPTLKLDDKTTLVGQWEDTLGTVLVFEDINESAASAMAEATPAGAGGEGKLRYLCKTEKRLRFRRIEHMTTTAAPVNRSSTSSGLVDGEESAPTDMDEAINTA